MQQHWQRIVIKIGSALIAPNGEQCSGQHLLAIAGFIHQCRAKGIEVILVSSGSVAAGRKQIKHHPLGPSIAEKQAMAAVGQSLMMANWQRFFDFPCGQILVTHADLADRHRYVNIKNTLRELLNNQVLPVVNENDSVATDELKVGDNDNLGAQVAVAADAQLLMICSDVDGLFDKDPRANPNANLIPQVDQIDASIYALAGGTSNRIATGGMRTKIQAADMASENGIDTLIVNGSNDKVFTQLLTDNLPGTLFKASGRKNKAKKRWLQHTTKASGKIAIDAGATRALQNQGASLLSKGVVEVQGQFSAGDAIEIVDHQSQRPIARGLSEYSHDDMQRIRGLHSDQISQTLGFHNGEEVVHRDNLVMIDN